MVAGNVLLSKYFFTQAEKVLDYILRSEPSAMKDYSIALAVNAMGWHAGYLCMPGGKSEKYLTMAKDICESIGAYNSDVYLRSMFAISTRPGLIESQRIVNSLERVIFFKLLFFFFWFNKFFFF